MPIDVVIPKGNEKSLAERLAMLGFDKVVFLYPYNKENFEHALKLSEKKFKVKAYFAFNVSNKLEARAIKNKLKEKFGQEFFPRFLVFAEARRQNIQDRFIDVVYGAELLEETESLHHRRSGINEAIARLLKEREKVYLFNISMLHGKEMWVTARLLGRAMQNARYAKKFCFTFGVATFSSNYIYLAHAKDMQAFARTLRLDTKKAKLAVNWIDYFEKIY